MQLTVKESVPLLDFLVNAMGNPSRTTVRNLLQYGSVQVDGIIQKRADFRLQAGQQVEVRRKEEWQPEKASRKAIKRRKAAPFPILYEDAYLIALEKPAGLLSIGTDREKTKTFYKKVSEYVKDSNGDEGKIFIVHRLDREVSGVMIFAKSEEIKEALQENWAENEKIYLALVEGHPRQREGTIQNWLKENAALQVYICHENTPGAQLAVTHYQVLHTYATKSLLEVKIETGRKHQIRIHLSGIGCPIVGDKKYGAVTSSIGRLGLHAFSLEFTHPVTEERIRLESAVPPAFKVASKE